jgi:hypothetical protein
MANYLPGPSRGPEAAFASSNVFDNSFPNAGNERATGPRTASEFGGDMFSTGLTPKMNDFEFMQRFGSSDKAVFKLPRPIISGSHTQTEPKIVLEVEARLYTRSGQSAFYQNAPVFVSNAQVDGTYGPGLLLVTLADVNYLLDESLTKYLDGVYRRARARTNEAQAGMPARQELPKNSGVRYVVMNPTELWQQFQQYGRLVGETPSVNEAVYVGLDARVFAVQHFGRSDFVPQHFSPLISVGDFVGYLATRFGTKLFSPVKLGVKVDIPPLQLVPYCSEFKHLLPPTNMARVGIFRNSAYYHERLDLSTYLREAAWNTRKAAGCIASSAEEQEKSIVAENNLEYDQRGYSQLGHVYVEVEAHEVSEVQEVGFMRGPLKPFTSAYTRPATYGMQHKCYVYKRYWVGHQRPEGVVTRTHGREIRPTPEDIWRQVTNSDVARTARCAVIDIDRGVNRVC